MILKDGKYEVKLRGGDYMIPADLIVKGPRIEVQFRYNKVLLEEIKMMEGRKWHGGDEPPRKVWSIANSPRNLFQLEFLQGRNPYAPYEIPILPVIPKRSLMAHQLELFRAGITYKRIIIAAEPGTGKSLTAIEIMEYSNLKNWWWIAPKSAMYAVQLECAKWKLDSRINVEFMTPENLTKIVQNWGPSDVPPPGLIIDESQKFKTPTSQRGQAAMLMANRCRTYHGDKAHIILMTGTPAPRSPVDWWHQVEMCCPGFLREGSIDALKNSVAIIKMMPSPAGAEFPKLLGWKDSPNRCLECGKLDTDIIHTDMMKTGHHLPVCGKDEVSRLYRRMHGLTWVKLKKDCVDLPDKIYREIQLPVKSDTLRLAKAIVKTAPRAVMALTLLRELSDGFQYDYDTVDGTKPCDNCYGFGVSQQPVGTPTTQEVMEGEVEFEDGKCPVCGGSGTVPKYIRKAVEVGTPKDDALSSLFDEYGDVGRLCVYAAFTESIDRCVRIAQQSKWAVIKVDSRGWFFINQDGQTIETTPQEMLLRFQSKDSEYPQIAFVAHPRSGGVGVTLTASPAIVYYSNSFAGEDRMQSEDRIHRVGMDVNRGATIIDLLHLPSDKVILTNLKNKAKLQNTSMGVIEKALTESSTTSWRL